MSAGGCTVERSEIVTVCVLDGVRARASVPSCVRACACVYMRVRECACGIWKSSYDKPIRDIDDTQTSKLNFNIIHR